jgi:hypothetical protein
MWCCPTATTTAATRELIWNGRRCNGCWRTSSPNRSRSARLKKGVKFWQQRTNTTYASNARFMRSRLRSFPHFCPPRLPGRQNKKHRKHGAVRCILVHSARGVRLWRRHGGTSRDVGVPDGLANCEELLQRPRLATGFAAALAGLARAAGAPQTQSLIPPPPCV